MPTITPTTEVQVIAYNSKNKEKVFTVNILEITPDQMLIKKGGSKFIYRKKTGTFRNARTGLKAYNKARFFATK
jgi:flagellar basal body rod protein FlgG